MAGASWSLRSASDRCPDCLATGFDRSDAETNFKNRGWLSAKPQKSGNDPEFRFSQNGSEVSELAGRRAKLQFMRGTHGQHVSVFNGSFVGGACVILTTRQFRKSMKVRSQTHILVTLCLQALQSEHEPATIFRSKGTICVLLILLETDVSTIILYSILGSCSSKRFWSHVTGWDAKRRCSQGLVGQSCCLGHSFA